MRINEDYLDRVTVADIDDEDIDDVVESQEPSPGKWKFAAVIEVRQSNINYRKRIEQILEMQTDDYNIFEMNNDFEDYLETNPLKQRNYVTQFDYKTDMFIVEFNCYNKPYILIYALASISDFFYSLSYESSKYDINQMIDYR